MGVIRVFPPSWHSRSRAHPLGEHSRTQCQSVWWWRLIDDADSGWRRLTLFPFSRQYDWDFLDRRWEMYARVAAFEQPDVSIVDDLIDTVRERSQSARTELPDAQAFLMLVDRENARSLGITFFENEEAIRRAEPAFERMGDEIPEETAASGSPSTSTRSSGRKAAKGQRPPESARSRGCRTRSMRASAKLSRMSSHGPGSCPAGRAITGSPTGLAVGRSSLPCSEHGRGPGKRATSQRASAPERGGRRRNDNRCRTLRSRALRATNCSVVLSPRMGRSRRPPHSLSRGIPGVQAAARARRSPGAPA